MSDSTTPVQSIAAPHGGGDGGTSASASPEDGRGPARRLGLGFVVLLVTAGIILAIVFFASLRHWVALHTGRLNGGPDKYYNFWSGFGSDLGEATLISAVGVGVYTGVRRVNCHTKGCWRIGHHPLDGTPYVLCRHHHPDVPSKGASHEHILEQHLKFKRAQGVSQNSPLAVNHGVPPRPASAHDDSSHR